MGNNIQTYEQKDGNRFLTAFRDHIQRFAIAKHTNYREFELSALLAINDSWKLQACLRTKEGQSSLRDALSYGASVGLSVNPQEGKACILAYETKKNGQKTGIFKASYQIMKNGMIELTLRDKGVRMIKSDLVRENDDFIISGTLAGDTYTHTPAIRDRGKVIGYFAALMTGEGQTIVKWLTIDEAKEHRDRYAASTKDGSMWHGSFDGAAIKTVLKMLLRNFHTAPELTRAITADDQAEVGHTFDMLPAVEDTPQLPGASPQDIAKAVVEERDDEPPPAGEEGSEGGDII